MESQLLKTIVARQEKEREEDVYRTSHHISTRRNLQLESAVNRGLAAAYLLNLGVGATMMREEGVPPQVVARVLRYPELRRATDWKR
ncbi:MAG TPA: hypothetical protein VFW68_12975 [Rhodocyclaceae bacterium]|nr:hypothetical protein [Rhodocyclaceae bacterium]